MSSRHLHAALDLVAEAAREGQLAGNRFPVRGGCMAPLLADGDEVTLAAARPLRAGQVVLARLGAELLCHRLLAVDGERCRLAGDTDLRLDVVPAADLLGRVASIATARFGGARLELPAIPDLAGRFLAGWHDWSCQDRGFAARRLEGLRRRLLARRAALAWARAATVATVGAGR